MVFDKRESRVTVPNVNIEDCDYTIAFWTRSTQWLLGSHQTVSIRSSSRFGKYYSLDVSETHAKFCREGEISAPLQCVHFPGFSNIVMNNWAHITVTCEQDNGVKMFFNDDIANKSGFSNVLLLGTPIPPKTFVVDYRYSPVIMDLLILGFTLPGDEIYDLYRG